MSIRIEQKAIVDGWKAFKERHDLSQLLDGKTEEAKQLEEIMQVAYIEGGQDAVMNFIETGVKHGYKDFDKHKELAADLVAKARERGYERNG